MSAAGEQSGPYAFTEHDLQADRLQVGAAHTVADFFAWRDANPHAIAEHVDRYTAHLEEVQTEDRLAARIGRSILPSREAAFKKHVIAREIGYFGVYDLAELLEPDVIQLAGRTALGILHRANDTLSHLQRVPHTIDEAMSSLQEHVPALQNAPEVSWLGEQLTRLHSILPETVVRDGSMGKVLRTITGVMAIGTYDTRHESHVVQRDHLSGILPAAYAYGATYAIIDDTLQDSKTLPREERERYHQVITDALASGQLTGKLPDHPVSEELERLHTIFLQHYPWHTHRHLYHAAEAMYLAQHRDALLTIDDVAAAGGLPGIYPDLFIKSSMTRVVANMLGRRHLDDDFYRRSTNTAFISQFRDDLADRNDDAQAGRITPFTYPTAGAGTNPLYDLFAYDAYVASTIFNSDPRAADFLSSSAAIHIAYRMPRSTGEVEQLLRNYPHTTEITRFLRTADRLGERALQRILPADLRLQEISGKALSYRLQTDVDPRTFVSDRIGYIDELLTAFNNHGTPNGLRDITEYALQAGGKRLRPALTLMLAEGLGVAAHTIEPLLIAIELFHTSSLLFDDLPAQDNATLRRGRAAAHTVYAEGDVQLSGVGMISSGFGVLARLRQHYPSDRITSVLEYAGTVLGTERLCLGQHMDLHMERAAEVSGEAILHMYDLKTSTMLEAALVPLMMLTDRPESEISRMKQYTHHAGIVYQIRDDILDATAQAADIGKDANNDSSKANIVRVYGLAEAERLMAHHLEQAIDSCVQQPFNTNLLQGVVRYFAARNR